LFRQPPPIPIPGKGKTHHVREGRIALRRLAGSCLALRAASFPALAPRDVRHPSRRPTRSPIPLIGDSSRASVKHTPPFFLPPPSWRKCTNSTPTSPAQEEPHELPTPGRPPAARLLDQVRQAALDRFGQDSPGQRFAHWTRQLVLFHDKRHPRDLSPPDLVRFRPHVAQTDKN